MKKPLQCLTTRRWRMKKMGFKAWWKNLSLCMKIIYSFMFILLLIFSVLFFYPVAGEITEGSLFLTVSCGIKPFHYVSLTKGSFICNNENHYTFEYLKNWNGYHGCNESTPGYNGGGGITNISRCLVKTLT